MNEIKWMATKREKYAHAYSAYRRNPLYLQSICGAGVVNEVAALIPLEENSGKRKCSWCDMKLSHLQNAE